MNDLFEAAIVSGKQAVRKLQKAARLIEISHAIFEYGIKTHSGKGAWPRKTKWMAVAPFDKSDIRDCARLMLDECRLLDEAGRVAEGRTRYEAVMALVAKLKASK